MERLLDADLLVSGYRHLILNPQFDIPLLVVGEGQDPVPVAGFFAIE
jgi:hypothetical protein